VSNGTDSTTTSRKRRVVKRKQQNSAAHTGSGAAAGTARRAWEGSTTQSVDKAGFVILVVDDSRTNRLFLSRMVKSVDPSATVLNASDGAEGLKVLQDRKMTREGCNIDEKVTSGADNS